ncbi:MAG: discoidin domain-containing protein, partial [Muribaculaceae bacterium]|nr:discoidin domain-containing protein [Muribaculaceae bacterium]
MCSPTAKSGEKLSGTPIGTVDGFNYETNRIERNIQGRAFDGDLNTYFATDARSYTWVGLDLGTPHVIDRIGWAPRNDSYVGPNRVQLGVIQGANSADWLDAVPLYIITEKGTIGRMDYADIDVRKGFRYVRFVSTSDARCNIAELEFYGTEGEGDTKSPNLFQVTNLPTVCINT